MKWSFTISSTTSNFPSLQAIWNRVFHYVRLIDAVRLLGISSKCEFMNFFIHVASVCCISTVAWCTYRTSWQLSTCNSANLKVKLFSPHWNSNHEMLVLVTLYCVKVRVTLAKQNLKRQAFFVSSSQCSNAPLLIHVLQSLRHQIAIGRFQRR